MTSAALLTTGCAGSFAPAALDTDTAAATAAVEPPISGSIYGGHAPIVNAQVYVLTPSTTTNAGLASSLMKSTTSTSGSTVYQDTSGGVSNGMYYVKSDGNGNFNLTGDYSCTVNQPVYIVAVGGSPQTPNNSQSSITGVSVGTTTGTGSAQTATLTFTAATTPTELYYVNEVVTLTGFTGALSYLNNSAQTVLATNLTTTTFAATASTYNGSANITGSYTGLSATATANTPNNPAAINMAALGVCPSSGSFAGHISYIYMNEISTAALAYATAAFGSDSFHIGVNQTGPLNTTGIPGYVTGSMVQAFNNAYLLYDITGSNISTTYAGEGHIARLTTPSNNGTVPQTRLDTIGNILAACVDSPNTSSSTSLQCSKLFNVATADGSSTGTKPTDIATAAFNIANFPAGTNNTSFASTLFNIPSGNVPFSPDLSTAPSDFSIGIQFTTNTASGGTNNLISNPQVLSIDGQTSVGTETGLSNPNNAIWIGSYSAQPVKLFANGTPDYATNSAGLASATRSRSVAVDAGGNLWIVNESSENLQQFSDSGTLLLTVAGPANQFVPSIYYNAVGTTIDATGNLYVDYEDVTEKITSAGANITYTGGGNSVWSTSNGTLGGSTAYTHNGYFDTTGLYYTINSSGTLCVTNPATAACDKAVGGFTVGTASNAVTFSSVDGNNTFWSTGYYNNDILGYNYAAQPNSIEYSFTGGGLNEPAATAIDGAGNIWVANAGNASLSAFTPTGTALSPTTGFGALGFASTNSADLAIDRCGDVWVIYSGGNYVTELIGIANPTVSPTVYATFHGFLGKRPL